MESLVFGAINLNYVRTLVQYMKFVQNILFKYYESRLDSETYVSLICFYYKKEIERCTEIFKCIIGESEIQNVA